ncbi:unnamed protein product, partial [Medioppia subpectinata]
AVTCTQYQSNGQDGGHNDIQEDKHHYQPYGFGYDIEDGYGNKQWRHEKSQQPSNVIGSYGFKDKDGIMREVEYVADKNGFRARIKTNEPGTAPKDPGDVKFEASPVVVSSHIKHTANGEQTGPQEEVYKYGGHDNNNNNNQRIQHRMGRVGRMRAAASRQRFVYLPYYD